LSVERTLDGAGAMSEWIVVSSHHRQDVAADLELVLAADFAPMLWIRGLVESAPVPAAAALEGSRLLPSATGRDGVLRSTLLFDALLEAASHFGDYRLPELFAGYSRRRYESPVPCPVACRPQA
jgi:hypothetical protein